MWRFLLIFIPIIATAQPMPPKRPPAGSRPPSQGVRPPPPNYYRGQSVIINNGPYLTPYYHYHVVAPTYQRDIVIEQARVEDKIIVSGSSRSVARETWSGACKEWKAELSQAYDVVSDASCGVVKCRTEKEEIICESKGSALVRNK